MTSALPSIFYSLHLPYTPKAGSITADPIREVLSEADLAHELAAFGGIGWVCYANGLRTEVPAAPLDASLGPILSAEFCHGAESLHVRLNGPHWQLLRLRETESPDCWLIRHEFLAQNPSPSCKKVTYDVCWTADPTQTPSALVPTLSRFTGFSA